MSNQRHIGLLCFVFCLLCLSTTTEAQMGMDQVIVPAVPTGQEATTDQRQARKTGPRHKNPNAAGQELRRQRTRTTVASNPQQLASPAYKNQRFKRSGEITNSTPPRMRRLMGPAYKNRRFKVRQTRVAKFKRRR